MIKFINYSILKLMLMLCLSSLLGCNSSTGGFIDEGFLGTPLAPVVNLNLTSINRLNSTNYELTGDCTSGSQVSISDGANEYQASCEDGTFSLTEDLSGLADGLIDFTVEVSLNDLKGSASVEVLKDSTGGPTNISLSPLTYALNSTYTIEVTFSSIVEVNTTSGAPSLEILIGGTSKEVQYLSGSGTNKLTFSADVELGEEDTDGLSLQSSSIKLNNSTLTIANAPSLLDLSTASNNLQSSTIYGVLPTVAISSASNITLANQQTYSIVGSCSDNNQNVEVTVGSLTFNRTCTNLAWTTGNIDVSTEGDDSLFSISVEHSDAAGNKSSIASTTVDKTTTVPVVTITTPQAITAANVTAYSLSGTCSENGRAVNVDLGGTLYSPFCASGFWNTGVQDVSVLGDTTHNISVTHQNALGSSATPATSTVTKDLSIPTVTISSPTNINLNNVASYSIGGTCSENGRAVNLNISGISLTPNCSGGTWFAATIDTSGLTDSYNISITANHDDNTGVDATPASATISKETTTPSISNLGTSGELVNTIDLSWIIENADSFTINDYVIQYRVKGTTIWLTFNDGTGSTPSSTVSGLNPSTTYEFRVRVTYNTSIVSAFSDIVEGETKPDDPLFGPNKAMNVGGASESRVVAFKDDTDVTLNGNFLITLQKGQTHTFNSNQFDVIDANNPIFTGGKRGPNNSGTAGANIVWQPVLWAGKSFSFNAIRNNPQQLLVYPIESGAITVKQGTTTLDTETLTKGVGATLSWSTYGSYQVNSTANVLLFHYSASGGFTDPKPILPDSKKIIGFPSTRMILTTSLNGTNYTAIHSDSTSVNNNISTGSSVQINSRGNANLFAGESLVIQGDQIISGASFADSNGGCAAPFLPTSYMKNAYAINARSDYVAFTSLLPGVIRTYDSSDSLISVVALSRAGNNLNAPYRARFSNQSAGTRYISSVPMAGWYQPNEYDGAMSSDETILYGTTLEAPGAVVVAPTNPITCKTLKEADSSLTDGAYTIDPDGDGGEASFSAYCDMTTQGGGWTLVIKYDKDQASAGDYSLPTNAGRAAINLADLQNLNATGNLAATQDLRPFIKGGATHLMHVTTAPGSTAYTHTYFSDISLTTRLLPDSIFDPQLDTNASESVAGSLAPWSDSSKTNWYESDFSVMTNSQTSGSAGSSNASISGGEGTAMWTNGSREGAVFCSGVSTSGGLDGHSNPKVQWGFRGKDGTQQTYGGATHVGTFCGSALGSGQCEPTQRMNLMWIR
jgi:hypothetical protein